MRWGGRLLRRWKGGQAKLKGYLEDHAMVAAALVDVYEATFDRRWLDEARGLGEEMLRLFWDERLEGFYDTGGDHERLIVRPPNLFDNAVPCGSSEGIPLLQNREAVGGRPTAYVCRNYACELPVTDRDSLARQLDAV